MMNQRAMNVRTIARCLVCVSSLAACAGLAMAVPTTQPPIPQPSVPQPSVLQPAASLPPGQPADQGTVLDLDFRGGTVGDYVDLVRATSKDVLNFVMPDGVAAAPMLPLTLRAVAIEDAVEMVERMARPKNNARLRVEDRPGRGSRTFIIEQSHAPMQPFGSPGASGRGDAELVTRVFSLNDIVGPAWAQAVPADGSGRLTSAVVLASLEQALSIASPEDAPAEVRFHSDSGLLFVRSTPAQSEVAERTIQTLQNDARMSIRGGEPRQPKIIRLTRVKPAELVDAIRAVYPVGMENGPEVTAGENAISISASSRIQFGIEALAAYLDGPRAPSTREIQTEMEVIGLRERLEQAKREQMMGRDEMAKMADQMRVVSIELERARLQAADGDRQIARLSEMENLLKDRSAELERAREVLAKLMSQQPRPPAGVEPPKEAPR